MPLLSLCFVSESRMVLGQSGMLHIVDVGQRGRIRSLDVGEEMAFTMLACPPHGAFIMAACVATCFEEIHGRIYKVDPGTTPTLEVVIEAFVEGLFDYA